MKTFLMVFVAIFGLAVVVRAVDTAAGETTEEILAKHRMVTIDGADGAVQARRGGASGKTALSDFHGEVIVLNFWASWCPPCRDELSVLDGWHKAWNGRGARVVAVSIDKDINKARRLAREEKLGMVLLHDGPDGLARVLDLPSVPCTFLLDTEGRVVRTVRGSKMKELTALRQQVETLLNARRVDQKAGMSSSSSALPDGGMK